MTTDLTVWQPTAMTLADKMDYARALATASLLPRAYQGNPGNLLFALEYADALGVSPINAITSIHVIDGKPSASADLIAGLVRRAGHRLRVSGDDTHALAQIIRADDPDYTYEARWDLDKARQAGLLGKGTWKNYPGALLRSRAITEVARMGASDALFGVIYTPEELGAEVNADGDIVDAPARAERPAGRSGVAQLRAAAAPPPPAPEPEPLDVTDAEVIDDEPAVEPITAAQTRKLHATLRDKGLGDRDRGLAFITHCLGHDVGSTKELSKEQARFVIDAAEALPDPAPVEPEQPALDDTEWPEVIPPGGAA